LVEDEDDADSLAEPDHAGSGEGEYDGEDEGAAEDEGDPAAEWRAGDARGFPEVDDRDESEECEEPEWLGEVEGSGAEGEGVEEGGDHVMIVPGPGVLARREILGLAAAATAADGDDTTTKNTKGTKTHEETVLNEPRMNTDGWDGFFLMCGGG
jgi:hypothetical protein